MTADLTTFYILIFIILGVFLVALSLTFFYFNLFIKYKNLKEEVFDAKKKDIDQFKRKMDEVKKQSLVILDEAQLAAEEIISRSQKVNEANNAELQKLVAENLKMQKFAYDEVFSTISGTIKKTFENLPSEVKKEIDAEISKLTSLVEADVKTFRLSMGSALKEPFEKAQVEAVEYKDARIKAFEERLFEFLSQLSKDVLRKELSVAEHESFIFQSLDQLKKEGALKK